MADHNGSKESWDGTGESLDWSWRGAEAGCGPVEIDNSRPSIARVYNAALGGRDNYPVDRAVIEAGRKISPTGIECARVNRDLLIRGVRYLAEQGIDQFLDLGSGLPVNQNIHEVIQSVNPDARVVYVDNDPIVLVHGQALLVRDSLTKFVDADILDVERLFSHPEIDGFLDFSRPLGLLMVAVIHHILDEENPVDVVNAYKERLAPGSHLFITHFCNTLPEARAMEEVLIASLGRGQLRSQEEITAFLDGLEIVEPGVVPLPLWKPDAPVREPLDHSGLLMVGGMGRKAAGTDSA